jgi:DNA polymerase-3 subunit beta
MKVICNQAVFSSSFFLAFLGAKAQSPKPILRNVKMEAQGNEIVLYATDMESGIRASFQCDQILEPGCVILPPKVGDFLRDLREEFVTIESDGNKVVLSGNGRLSFTTEDAEEFPGTPVFGETNYIVTKARYVKEAIRRTQFATESESGRYALGGVLMDYREGKLNFVSTDGRRMAVQEIEATVHGEFPELKIAIATKNSLLQLDKLLNRPDEDVSIALLDNSFKIQTEGLFYYASLLEGRFPEWRLGINQLKNPKTIQLPIGNFDYFLRRAAICTDPTNPGVVLEIGDGKMQFWSVLGTDAVDDLSFAIDYQDEPVTLKLNVKFLSDFLKTLSADSVVQMSFMDSRSGVLFQTEDGYRYLVMPMHLDRKRPSAQEESDG